jgi:ferric-dicitrate binding protein FerR (iron transport regulator)
MHRSSRAKWWRYVVAACALVAAAGITYLIRSAHSSPATVVAAPTKPADIQPGGNKGTLTLADGKVVNLDSAADGVLTSQGNTYVAKADGKLAYNIAASEKPTTPTYNVLATPRAGQFTLALPDGTQVWLNNASSIRYPVWFTGPTREVELTGEAYFEVAKDAAHPFRVHIRNSAAGAEGGTIEVLGTSFNVMAYADENAERATLVAGSVKYVHGASSALLKPDDESVFAANGKLRTLHDVDVDEITAWKNGFFHFDRSDFETTMRQFARWYAITVVYQGKIAPQEFNGKIPRSATLATLLKGLEGENVHFALDGKQVTATP